MNVSDVAWVFVCQSGRLEQEACVLAASLRKMLGTEAKLIAAIPLPERVMKSVAKSTVDFLESIDVSCRRFTNRLFEEGFPGYRGSMLMMNKPYAIELESDARVTVFLDSDQICIAPFELLNLSVPMIGRCVYYAGAKAVDGLWERAFQICDTNVPRQRNLIQRNKSGPPVIVTFPFFNGGFISIHRAWMHAFLSNYINCYKRISDHNILGGKRYFEEELALAIAVIKTEVPYEIDRHRLNKSFMHYIDTSRLADVADRVKYVNDLTVEFSGLREVLEMEEAWKKIIETC